MPKLEISRLDKPGILLFWERTMLISLVNGRLFPVAAILAFAVTVIAACTTREVVTEVEVPVEKIVTVEKEVIKEVPGANRLPYRFTFLR